MRSSLAVAALLLTAAAPASLAADPGTGTPPAHEAAYGYLPTLPVAPLGIDWLSGFPDGTAYVKHSDGGVPLLARSTDFGHTWSRLPDPPFGGHAITKFATPRRGYSVGNGQVSTSDDAAASWRFTNRLPHTAFASLHALGVGQQEAAGTVYVAGDGYGPPVEGINRPLASYVWFSHDGGQRWARTALPEDLFVDDIRVFDRLRAAARVYDLVGNVGNRTAVWLTSDGGRSWRRAFDCPQICTSVAHAGPATVFAGTVDGRLYGSGDGGRRWSLRQSFPLPVPTPPPANTHWVSGIAFTRDGRTAVLGTNGRGTYRSTDGGRSWSRESPSPQEVYGLGIGDAVIFDSRRALVGGPNALAVRSELPGGAAASLPLAPAPAGGTTPLATAPRVQHLPDGTLRLDPVPLRP